MAGNVFKVTTKFLSCHLFGCSATVAATATLGAGLGGAGYAEYKFLNDKKLRQDLLKPFENRNATVADVNNGSIVIIIATDNEESARTIEDDCKSNKILDEINEQIRKYNEVNEENVDYFTNIEVIKVETVTLAADDWKKLKEKFKENIDKVFQTELQPYKDESLVDFLQKFGYQPKKGFVSTKDGKKITVEKTVTSNVYNVKELQTLHTGDVNITVNMALVNVTQRDEMKGLHNKMDLIYKRMLELKEFMHKTNQQSEEAVEKMKNFEKVYFEKKELQKEIEKQYLEVVREISLLKKQRAFTPLGPVLNYMAQQFKSPGVLPTLKAPPVPEQHPEKPERSDDPDQKLQTLELKFEMEIQSLKQEVNGLKKELLDLTDDVRPKQTFIHKDEWFICWGAEQNKIYYCKESAGTKLHIKKILFKHPYTDAESLTKFIRNCNEEIDNLRLLRGNKYILKYIKHEEKENHFEIVTELCNGNVDEYATCLELQRQHQISEKWPKPLPKVEGILELKEFAIQTEQDYLSYFMISPMEVVKQMIEGIFTLHSNDLVHQDIKPHNFLLKKCDAHTVVKVSDFGLTRKLFVEKSTAVRGTQCWMPPELVEEHRAKPDIKCDIFSLGLVLFYTINNGKHPYGPVICKQSSKIYDGEHPEMNMLYEGNTLQPEERINACDLILWMLQHEAENRPSCAEVKCHPMMWEYKEKVEFLIKVAAIILSFESPHSTVEQRDDSGRSNRTCAEKQQTAQLLQQVSEQDVTQVLQPVESDATAFLAVSEEKSFNMVESVSGLEQYPTWLIDGLKSGEEEVCHFVIKRDTLRELGEILQLGEQRTKCSSVKEILFIMKATKEDESLSDETKDKLGLGENKDWEKFYSFFTKDNPQILARTYQLFKSHPELREFKQALLEQDRGPAE